MRKFIITAELRDITDQYDREEISYSRMQEILNEKALQYAKDYAKEFECKIDLIEILTNFQLFLNDKKLINNHDWGYEKEAKSFIKKYKPLPTPPQKQ